jgi:hypothetical protein
MKNITSKRLDQLLGKWKDELPREGYSSSIQMRSYNLYGKTIDDFSVDDIRFMIVQRIGLNYLIPLALNYLKNNLLLEANYYEGDLLHSILMLPKQFWEKNLNLYSDVYQILLQNKDVLQKLDPYYEADKKLINDYRFFLQILNSK